MSKFLAWLKSLFIHSSEEKPEMTDQVVETTATTAEPTVAPTTTAVPSVDTTASVTAAATTTSEADAVCERLRKLVVAAGAQAHVVIDDLIALAKKLG